MPNTNATWEQWNDKHSQPEQIQRQMRASDKKLTPISIDIIQNTGLFKGTSGQYTTFLSSCNCTDFGRRKLPCKHMYRLAYELGLFQLSKSVNKSNIVPLNKDEAMCLIRDALTEDEQISFKNLCYECGNDNSGESLLPGDFAQKLLSYNLVCEISNPEILLKHVPMNDVRKFLPPSAKSPRTKVELIALVAPLVTQNDIVFKSGQKCVTLHPCISHLGHTLHRKLCAIYPSEDNTWL